MINYKLQKGAIFNEVQSVLNIEKGLHIPFDPANTDYQEYLAWLAEGNTPTPADES